MNGAQAVQPIGRSFSQGTGAKRAWGLKVGGVCTIRPEISRDTYSDHKRVLAFPQPSTARGSGWFARLLRKFRDDLGETRFRNLNPAMRAVGG